MATKLATLIQY